MVLERLEQRADLEGSDHNAPRPSWDKDVAVDSPRRGISVARHGGRGWPRAVAQPDRTGRGVEGGCADLEAQAPWGKRLMRRATKYDKSGEEHYNLISALAQIGARVGPGCRALLVRADADRGRRPALSGAPDHPDGGRGYRSGRPAGADASACTLGRCTSVLAVARGRVGSGAGGGLPGARAQVERGLCGL